MDGLAPESELEDEEPCMPLDDPASASNSAAFFRMLASLAGCADTGDLGNELDEAKPPSELKSECDMEKGLCMPLPVPIRGSISMGAAADIVAAMEGYEGVLLKDALSLGVDWFGETRSFWLSF